MVNRPINCAKYSSLRQHLSTTQSQEAPSSTGTELALHTSSLAAGRDSQGKQWGNYLTPALSNVVLTRASITQPFVLTLNLSMDRYNSTHLHVSSFFSVVTKNNRHQHKSCKTIICKTLGFSSSVRSGKPLIMKSTPFSIKSYIPIPSVHLCSLSITSVCKFLQTPTVSHPVFKTMKARRLLKNTA